MKSKYDADTEYKDKYKIYIKKEGGGIEVGVWNKCGTEMSCPNLNIQFF